jgi:hypothetical protein
MQASNTEYKLAKECLKLLSNASSPGRHKSPFGLDLFSPSASTRNIMSHLRELGAADGVDITSLELYVGLGHPFDPQQGPAFWLLGSQQDPAATRAQLPCVCACAR